VTRRLGSSYGIGIDGLVMSMRTHTNPSKDATLQILGIGKRDNVPDGDNAPRNTLTRA